MKSDIFVFFFVDFTDTSRRRHLHDEAPCLFWHVKHADQSPERPWHLRTWSSGSFIIPQDAIRTATRTTPSSRFPLGIPATHREFTFRRSSSSCSTSSLCIADSQGPVVSHLQAGLSSQKIVSNIERGEHNGPWGRHSPHFLFHGGSFLEILLSFCIPLCRVCSMPHQGN